MKGVRQKAEFSDGLPSGSKIFMNPKSSYILADLFLTWLTEYFFPRKCSDKTLLISDGHSAHLNVIDMLECSETNAIIVLCLLSHTTQSLQLLDHSLLERMKDFF
jgi:hypothetical protein